MHDIDLTYVDRMMLILVLSACWIFIYIGLQAEDEDDINIEDVIAFYYSHIVIITATAYVAYRAITRWK